LLSPYQQIAQGVLIITDTRLGIKTDTGIDTGTKTDIQTKTQAATQLAVAIATRLGIKDITDIRDTGGGNYKLPDINLSKPASAELQRKREAFTGAATWEQGAFYKAWKYPYEPVRENLATFKEPPPDAVIIPHGTPNETITWAGNMPPPPDREVSMGVVTFHIHTMPDGKLRIDFAENKEVAETSRGGNWWEGVPRHTHKTKKSSETTSAVSRRDDYFITGAL
jgi:hypothetical protein